MLVEVTEVAVVLVEGEVLEWIVSVVGSLLEVVSVELSVELSVVVVSLVVGVAVVELLEQSPEILMQKGNHTESVVIDDLLSDGSMMK